MLARKAINDVIKSLLIYLFLLLIKSLNNIKNKVTVQLYLKLKLYILYGFIINKMQTVNIKISIGKSLYPIYLHILDIINISTALKIDIENDTRKE